MVSQHVWNVMRDWIMQKEEFKMLSKQEQDLVDKCRNTEQVENLLAIIDRLTGRWNATTQMTTKLVEPTLQDVLAGTAHVQWKLDDGEYWKDGMPPHTGMNRIRYVWNGWNTR